MWFEKSNVCTVIHESARISDISTQNRRIRKHMIEHIVLNRGYFYSPWKSLKDEEKIIGYGRSVLFDIHVRRSFSLSYSSMWFRM